jgi:hypothetical protein
MAAPYLHDLPEGNGHEPAERQRHRKNEPGVDLVRRGRIVEQHQHPDRERNQPRHGEGAVCHDVRVDHQQSDCQHDQGDACPARGEDRESE